MMLFDVNQYLIGVLVHLAFGRLSSGDAAELFSSSCLFNSVSLQASSELSALLFL